MTWRRLLTVLGLALAAFVLLPNVLPKALFYQRGRPTRAGRVVTGLFAAWSALGLPPHFAVTLEVRGRVSGKTYSIPVAIAACDGADYLVSMLGNDVAWVRNVRAAGGQATIRHGGRRPVVLEDVPAEARAPILKAYLRRAMGAREHFDIGPDAPLEQFEQIASRYPVFQIHDSPFAVHDSAR